jgi:hypothetical protein
MLISRRGDKLVLVTQPDHAVMAGDIVSHWGNDTFAQPQPLESVRLAAALHDDGWTEADAEPLLNTAEQRPLHFLEIDMKDHIPLYGRGVQRTYEKDPYAGLLVSMHWTGLYRSRWGLQDGKLQWQDGVEQLMTEAVDSEEQRWIEVKRQLLEGVKRSDFEAALWHHFDLLQAWDLLSLYMCLLPHTPAENGEVIPVPKTLKSLDQTPSDRVIQSVPLGVARERVDITLRAVEPGVVTLDPYPFDEPSVEFSVPAKAIDDRAYESTEDARAAIDAGEDLTISCRMTKA